MSTTAYRDVHEAPPIRVSTGWVTDVSVVVLLLGMAICAVSALLFRGRAATASLDCTAEGCKFEDPHRGTTWLPRDGRYLVSVAAMQKLGQPVEGTYFVRVFGTTSAELSADGSSESAQDLAGILMRSLKDGVEAHRRYGVGAPASAPLGVGALGLVLVVLWCVKRGVYEVVVDRENDSLAVRRVRGLVPRTALHVALSTVAEVASQSVHPDKAFSRYQVVFRLRDGSDCAALPLSLRQPVARRIAARLDDALQPPMAL
jgi:hypothetical protein